MAKDKEAEPMSVEDALTENAGKSLFTGHPADTSSDEPVEEPDKEADKEPDKEPDKDSKKEPDKEPDKEADKKPEADKDKEPDKEPEPSKLKYKSHEEAEAAYQEAERLISKKADEAKRERERAEELQRQINEALLNPKPEPEPEKKVQKPTGTERMKGLMSRINQLDPERDGYEEEVAALWGQYDDELRAEFHSEHTESVQAAISEYDKRKTDEANRVKAEQEQQNAIIKKSTDLGVKSGLDMKDGSVDSALFWAMSNNAPEGSIDEQVNWTIDAVKKHKATIVAPYIESQKKADKAQNKNAVLDRASQGKPEEKKTPQAPLSVGDAMEQAQRRI